MYLVQRRVILACIIFDQTWLVNEDSFAESLFSFFGVCSFWWKKGGKIKNFPPFPSFLPFMMDNFPLLSPPFSLQITIIYSCMKILQLCPFSMKINKTWNFLNFFHYLCFIFRCFFFFVVKFNLLLLSQHTHIRQLFWEPIIKLVCVLIQNKIWIIVVKLN